MKTPKFALILAALVLTSFGLLAKTPHQLTYTVSPLRTGNALKLAFEVTFRGNSSGRTLVKVPYGAGDFRHFEEAITHFTSHSPGASVADSTVAYYKIIQHKPNQVLKLSYHAAYNPDDKGFAYDDLHPRLSSEYVFFQGQHYLVMPTWDSKDSVSCRITWRKFPRNWSFANNFGARQSQQNFTAQIGNLKSAFFLAGDYRVHQRLIKDKPIYVAVRGQWKFTDEALASTVAKVLAAQRDFFQDHAFPYLLVSVTPSENPGYAAMATHNAFTIVASDTVTSVNSLGIMHTILHEPVHTWIGGKLQLVDAAATEPAWFQEGVTDYYAYEFGHRTGILSRAQYLKAYNRIIAAYYLSPARNMPLPAWQQSKVRYSDRNIYQLPYQTGNLLAHHWDYIIRRNSKGQYSFDDVLRTLLDVGKTKDAVVPEAALIAAVLKYSAYDIRSDLQRSITEGQTIPVETAALGLDAEMRLQEMDMVDAGFDVRTSQADKMVRAVKAGSNAAKAGLQDGQKLLEVTSSSTANQLTEVRIQDATGVRLIRYYPVGEKVVVPQYYLKP